MLAVLAAAVAAGKDKTMEVAPGVNMPVLLLGTGYVPPKGIANATEWQEKTVQPMVKAWLDTGARGIDTAYFYYTQDGIREAIAASGVPRSDIFIMTKIPGIFNYSMATHWLEQDQIQLGGAPLDCVISHGPWCGGPTPDLYFPGGDCSKMLENGANRKKYIQETWRALEDFYNAKKARCIGISNYCASDVRALLETAKVKPHIHQFERNPYYKQEANTQFNAEQGIKVMQYAPLGDSDRQSGKGPAAGAMLKDPTIVRIGQAHNLTGAQVCLQWSVQGGHPAAVRIGGPFEETPTPAYVVEDTAVSFGVEKLTDAEMAEIDALKDQTSVWGAMARCRKP